MNKKEIIFWAVLISISVIFTSVVIFYKPITPPVRYNSITVHSGDSAYEITPQTQQYKPAKKIVNKAINSSRNSLLNPSSTQEVVCNDDTVLKYKLLRRYWVECFPDTGRYEKLFFWVNEDTTGRQTMLIFASKTKDTYDGGKLLLMYDTDTLTLLNSLKDFR